MASPITVTASLTDPSSTALQGNSFLRFILRNFSGFVPQVSGTSILPEIQIDALPNGSGAISQTLWKNSDISPATTFYTVQLWNQGRITSSGNYIFNASTSLNTASQLNAPPVPAGFSLVFENNGVLNSSQSILNLVNTDGSVTLTDLGAGNIQVNAATTGFAAAGTGGFWSSGFPLMASWGTSGITAGNPSTSIDQLVVFQFTLQSTWTIRQVSCNITTGQSGGLVNFGIYTAAGNKVLDSGGLTATSSNVTQSNAITPVVLPPGVYYFAQSSHNTTTQVTAFTGSSTQMNTLLNLNGTVKVGTAANATVSGVMPATLGTITAVNNAPAMAAALFGV